MFCHCIFTTNRNVVTELGVMRSCVGVCFFSRYDFLQSDWSSRSPLLYFPRFYAVRLERLPWPITCVLGVVGVWNVFSRFTPSWGGRAHKCFKKFDDFFVLLVPLTIRLITHVLKVLWVWNLLCVLTPLMWDRLPHFCFKIRRKMFFEKVFISIFLNLNAL